jgi:hypothetical protein
MDRDPPCAHNHKAIMSLLVRGLRRHGPIFVVDAPRRSDGYAFVASPRIWGRGARNAVRPHSSATC